ncbi:MAG: inositol 2-dehydrogenase [Clostridiales bacterium]|jgi:myo-inositol 2-dehydrogenase/D-chiro-inositol 1-dehydrogenase|nr:inositol 2-dehydrogenase [Clostridiales bacterium]
MLKIGIIGCGRIGRVHCKSIAHLVPEAEVAAVADPLMNDEIKAFARQFGIKRFYEDYHEILEDKGIDAVLICSPTDTHSEISIESACAGKHIFCEKPIDRDIGRIRKVIDAVRMAGVKFQVGFNRRFDSNFKAVRDAVATGKIGDVEIIKITSRDPAPPPPEYIAVSGGMFLDMTIHDFDMARYISGSEAVEVYAAAAVMVDSAIGEAGDVDTAVVTVKLANGALAVIDNSRRAAYGYDQRAEAFGSLGCVSISNNTNSSAVLSTSKGVCGEKPLYFFLERYLQSFGDEIKAFAQAAAGDTDTPVGLEDGLAPVLMALAAKKSAAEHRPVRISEIEQP